MTNNILDGFSLVDPLGRALLATTITTLLLGIGTNLSVRARYASFEKDLDDNGAARRPFEHAWLNDVVRSAEAAARRTPEPNTQAIVEDHVQSDLRSLLFAERFVRSATGLVIILGLLGTFYGLTSSIGKLVVLVGTDAGGVADVAHGVTSGLTEALTGMAVAFSNSLVGIGSAVILTVLGVFSSLTDRRVALMIRIETYLDRFVAEMAPVDGAVTGAPSGAKGGGLERSLTAFGDSVDRLESAVGRFESALVAFSTSTRDFSEFNAHLKDNVQRMSLTFGDLSDALKTHVNELKRTDGR